MSFPERPGRILMDVCIDLAHERTRAALDTNYLAYSSAQMGSSAYGEYGERRDVALICCGAPLAQYNVAHLKPPLTNPAAALEYAEDYFGRRQFPFSVEIRRRESPDYFAARECLAAAGYEPVGTPIPGMALAPMRESQPPPKGLTVERVQDADALDRFARVASVGFGFPEQAGGQMLTPAFLDRPGVQAFLGKLDGEVVATSQLLVSGTIAGIYWVSTVATLRRRGFGEAITWAAVDAGRRAGCTLASLQASAMGRPVYARMGFAHVIDYERYERRGATGA